MNRLSTMVKAIGMIALVVLLLVVPIEIGAAEMPDNPADSLERPAEVIELAPGETSPRTGIRPLTPEEMKLLLGIDIAVSMPISGRLLPGVWYAHGGWMFRPGGTMVISVAWAPAGSDVGLGYRCADTGLVEVWRVAGGSGGIGLRFPRGGTFQAVVHNFGPFTISYSGIVDVGGIRQLTPVDLAFGETCPKKGIRALTPEEVQQLLLQGNGPEELPGGPWGPWLGIEDPVLGPILFSIKSAGPGHCTAEMLKAGRIRLYVYPGSSRN